MSLAATLALAVALHASGKLDEAEPLYREVLAVEPAATEARVNLVSLLVARGRLSDAEPFVEDLTALEPATASHWTLLASLRLNHGDEPGATSALELGLRLDGGDGPTALVLGDLLLRRNDPEGALRWYREALATLPADATVHLRMASALLDLGRNDVALDECAAAREVDPSSRDAAFLTAEAHLHRLDGPGALLALDRAWALAPDDPRLAPMRARAQAIIARFRP